jgi:hypothetical protein
MERHCEIDRGLARADKTDERLRQPVFPGLREDKEAKEVVLEKA